MKSYSKTTIIFCITLLFSLSNCISNQPDISKDLETSFKKIFPIKDMNRSLQLIVEDVKETEDNNNHTFEYGSDISLKMVNMSDYQILFDSQSHIKLFVIRNGKWQEIGNKITYSGELLLAPKGKPLLDFKTTRVNPIPVDNVLREGEREILRIVLFGELMQDGVLIGEPVGASVDVFVR